MTQTTAPSAPEIRTACGGILKDLAGYPAADHHGRMIFFCTGACLRAFEENPETFMAGEIEHPADE